MRTGPIVPAWRFLPGIFEPSAVHPVADNRFLVVEDEKDHPFSLFWLQPDGNAASQPLHVQPPSLGDPHMPRLADLEGLTGDALGRLYAITSHSRTSQGEAKASRDRLVRFRLNGDQIGEVRLAPSLKPALAAAHPALDEAARVLEVKAGGGLNIEALEMSPEQDRLLIGLRGPLLAGRAIIAALEDPEGLFEHGRPPRIATPLLTLDLAGQGIRALCHVPALGGYLVIAGPVDRRPEPFRLWFWPGPPATAARRLGLPGGLDLAHGEGVCAGQVAGEPRILLVSDEGDRDAGRPARYLCLAPEDLVPG